MVMVTLTVYLKKVKMLSIFLFFFIIFFIMHNMPTTEVIGVNSLDKDQNLYF